MIVAVALDKGFYDFEFQVRRRKSIVMLLDHMHNKFASESAHCHGDNIGVGYFAFDPTEQPQKGVRGKQVVQIFIGESDDPLLLLVSMVHLHQLSR